MGIVRFALRFPYTFTFIVVLGAQGRFGRSYQRY
jgi:hypothetical protein